MRACWLIFGGIIAGQFLGAEPASTETGREAEQRLTSVVRADLKSGKLVRSVVVRQRAVSQHAPAKRRDDRVPGSSITDVGSLIDQAARTHDIDPLLVHSMIKVESNYNPFAVSPKGALGLMQLMPSTARQLGVKNVFDARENIDGGVRYYKYLKGLYKNDDRLALAAYNAGPGAVSKYGTVPPFPETISYVQKVGRSYGRISSDAERKPAPENQSSDTPAEEPFSKLVEVVDAQGRIYLQSR